MLSRDVQARRHAALGDTTRLALVDDLLTSDRSPGELSERHGLSSNLLAHHLAVLEDAGLVERVVSSGDGRRRYVQLRHSSLLGVLPSVPVPDGPVLFVCTHNSARSQLAEALWRSIVGTDAASAGTRPSDRVHPGAVAAAERAGLDLSRARPRHLHEVQLVPSLVVTVCDRAHEELIPDLPSWHWSTPDPLEQDGPDAFERALERLRARVTACRHYLLPASPTQVGG